jgi:3-oxoacyl-(acyl-carrier-protein) synthase
MRDPVILAASYLGPEGFGNDQTGLRAWPAPLAAAFQRHELAQLHWSLLFTSDPSRFARMDLMSRLGLMAAELLDAGLDVLPPERRERIGVCVETCAGSLATDVRFLRTPKPTLFTYTLPSTVIGEICIRYRLKGPVLCLVTPEPSRGGALAEAIEWLDQGDADACLCLGCDVIDREVPEFLPWPKDLPALGWHACAFLLGAREGKAREHPLAAGVLAEVCRRLCMRSEGV